MTPALLATGAVAPNDSDTGMQKNRKVEIVVSPKP